MKRLLIIAMCLLWAGNVWAFGFDGGGGSSSQITKIAQPKFSYDFAKDFGAKCDNVFLSDGVTTASSTAFTSASASFSSADVGKTITVKSVGSQVSAVSGTPTLVINGVGGSTTYSYVVTAIVNGPGTNGVVEGISGETTVSATATTTAGNATLTAGTPLVPANSITITWTPVAGATSYYVYRIAGGPTQGLITYGNLGESGSVAMPVFTDTGIVARAVTPPVTNTAYGWLNTTIASFVNTHTITLSISPSISKTNVIFDYATDDSTSITAALAALNTNGGGTLQLPQKGICKITSKIIFSNVNMPDLLGNVSLILPVQPSIRITSSNPAPSNGYWTHIKLPDPINGLNLVYAGSDAKILTMGTGRLELDHFTIMNSSTDLLPFILTTNTALYIHDMAFQGGGGGGSASLNPALILGGSTASTCATSDCGFQGYGTVIRDNYFDRISTVALFQAASNGSLVTGNIVSDSCGDINSSPFRFKGASAAHAYSNSIVSNFIGLTSYKYAVEFDYADNNTVAFNNFEDPDKYVVSGIFFKTNNSRNTVMNVMFNRPLTSGDASGQNIFDFASTTNNTRIPGTFTVTGNNNFLGVHQVNGYLPRAYLDINGNASNFVEGVTNTYGTAIISGVDTVIGDTTKGILDIEMSGNLGSVNYGPTLTFSNNRSIYSASNSHVAGGIKVGKTNASNQDGTSYMSLMTNSGSTVIESLRLTGISGSAGTVVCWKTATTQGYATVAEITAGTCH